LEEIIIQLLGNREYVSGEKIAENLNISRTAVWKYIQKLRSQGYIIESKQNIGYKLLRETNLLLPVEIKKDLKTVTLGSKIYHFKEVNSTQEIAKKKARNGAAEGTLIISEQQHLGRGRLDRRWISPAGGVWLSLILRPGISLQHAQRIVLTVAIAVAKAFNKLYNIDAKIKWPNDIIVNDKKICGILIETEGEMDKLNFMILGVGANINNSLESLGEIINTATSVMALLGNEVSRPEFVRTFLEEFENLYQKLKLGFFNEILNEWKNLSNTLGALVTVETPDEKFEGIASDLDDNGFLIVKLQDNSIKKVFAGDVKIRKLKN
jgi:BirA family biotin operon repressor/biotin-[acetyl-CoA-carboxylase] ligase